MLRRKIAAELERWLKSAEQKALFITGSRQIGKSYSIRAFGKASHATYIELNLMENRQAKDALLEARDADDFISRVTLLSGKSIAPGKTLVFIDEVQEAPDIMTGGAAGRFRGQCSGPSSRALGPIPWDMFTSLGCSRSILRSFAGRSE